MSEPWIARLLSPDDAVIKEYAVPHFALFIDLYRPTRVTRWVQDDALAMPSFETVRFEFQPRETELYQLLVPRVLIYRQEGAPP